MQRVDFQSAAQFSVGAYSDNSSNVASPTFLRGRKIAEQADAILTELLQFRRMTRSEGSCAKTACPRCAAPHLDKIKTAIVALQPVTFVLPAFPGKSPNPAKVLGPLPDMGEQRALQFLDGLCRRIRRHYKPGARIILCSDGRVFSDVVGMMEADVTAYQHELDRMIDDLGLEYISTFNLDELRVGDDFDQIRKDLMEEYGHPLETLKEKVSRGGRGSEDRDEQDAHRLFCGVTRFLFEDAMHPGQRQSRTAVQKESRIRAYEVIRRSNAWSELIAERFPSAVRLSIHPQTCGSRKLGIQLLGDSSWMTPWHGVAVDTGDEFVLMKRWEAEKHDSILVRDASGRASHFQLQSSLTAAGGARR